MSNTNDIETPRILQSTNKETTIAADGTSSTTTTSFYSDGSKEVKTVSTTASPTDSTRLAKPIEQAQNIQAVSSDMVVEVPPGSGMTKVVNGSSIPDAEKEGNWKALTAMILGIVSLFFFGFVLGILAIVFASCALSEIKKEPRRFNNDSKDKAISGLTTGIIGIVAWIILVAVYFST